MTPRFNLRMRISPWDKWNRSMEQSKHRKVIIIGSGPAGLSAAIYAARADLQPLVISGMSLYGQVSLTTTIENYPGFPNGINGPDLGSLFEEQARKFGSEIVFDVVQSLDLSAKPFKVVLSDVEYTADAIILAMGAEARKLNVPGENEYVGRGISYCATCDGWFFKDKNIHVVGGGDSAIEEALFLTRFARSVTVIHRRDTLRAGAILENRARNHPKVKFIWDTVVKEIRGNGSVHELLVESVKTGAQEIIPTDGIFIFIGHDPNIGIIAGQLKMTAQGTVAVDDRLQTSIPGVFAAGDITDAHFRQVVTSAGMGAAAAISAVSYLETLD